jgi:hypothetical protein
VRLITKLNKEELTDAIIFLCIIVVSVFMLKIMSISMKREEDKSKSGVVYLISTSGRVQISDFKGLPYIENGYYMWYDKKGNKHWTKAPLMFTETTKK